ncbi:MAG TPA: chlorite dismutase family protein [Anaerolineae bacterium]|nr:chlorite dismutase family protein [Anaerolineae bacterium]
MPEETPRTLNHFALLAFKDAYWTLAPEARTEFRREWLAGLRKAAHKVDVYQVFPTESGSDVLVWSAVPVEAKNATAEFFERFACATNPYRAYLQLENTLWGYTRPSQYTKTRSTQEIDPFAATRQAYLVIYPFIKTIDWYLMSRDARQGMMNEHIRIGKQYEDITQLLLYSFGVQDQEFVVVYETDDLLRFSDLVNELRGTEVRRYTQRDTPLHTAIYHPAEETLALWR